MFFISLRVTKRKHMSKKNLKPTDKRLKQNKRKKNVLTEEQRTAVLQWMAEGVNNETLKIRSGEFIPPFEMSDQHIYSLRRANGKILTEIRKENDLLAITKGLALRSNRIDKLTRLADDMEKDLFELKKTWLEDKKMLGEEEYTFYKYNQSQVDQYRKVLDDVAKEVGGRVQRTDITTGDQPIKGYVGISPDDWDKEKEE